MTTGASPATAPGVHDTVTVNGASGPTPLVVTGPGNSAGLTLRGSTALAGAFSTGAFWVGSQTLTGNGTLAAGTTVYATSIHLYGGPLTVSGPGTRLIDSGALTTGLLRDTPDLVNLALTVTNGAAVQVADVYLAGSGYPAGTIIDTGQASISIDATSSLEVGTLGGAAAGTLTIDPYYSVDDFGSISAAGGIVDNGKLILVEDPTPITSPISGSGTLQIQSNAIALGSVSVAVNIGEYYVLAVSLSHAPPATSGPAYLANVTGPISGLGVSKDGWGNLYSNAIAVTLARRPGHGAQLRRPGQRARHADLDQRDHGDREPHDGRQFRGHHLLRAAGGRKAWRLRHPGHPDRHGRAGRTRRHAHQRRLSLERRRRRRLGYRRQLDGRHGRDGPGRPGARVARHGDDHRPVRHGRPWRSAGPRTRMR